jgi:quercetin dioxygenase-like cupin family protein
MNEAQPAATNESGRECEWHLSAAAHVLGNVSDEESRAYSAHLDACGSCRDEFEFARQLVARVDRSLCSDTLRREPGAGPTPQARERLLARIASTPQDAAPSLTRTWQTWSEDAHPHSAKTAAKPGFACIAASDDGWQSITAKDSGLPAIDVKRLSVDAKRRYVTMLVRMAPGATYPSHRHAGNEECFVLSGDLKVGERVLHAGDYQIAAEDSVHGVQSTENGCTLLIVSSQDDQLVG